MKNSIRKKTLPNQIYPQSPMWQNHTDSLRFVVETRNHILLNISDKETGISVEMKELNSRYPKYSHLSLLLKLPAHNLRKLN